MELQLNWIEALWLASTGVASYFTHSNLIEAKADRLALWPLKNGRLILANGAIRRDRLRLIKLSIMALIGLFAAMVPGEANLVGGLLFLMLPFLILMDSAAEARDRRAALQSRVQHLLAQAGNEDQGEDHHHEPAASDTGS